MKTIIATENAPAAIGPYSQAVEAGGAVYCSGQIPLDPETGDLVTDSIAAATRQVLQNLGSVLEAADLGYGDVVKCTVFLLDMADFAAMNDVYAEFFAENPPARACVQAARLPKDVPVEIECIAVRG